MQTAFYIIGIIAFCFVCFGVYRIIKLIEGKPTVHPKNPNVSNLSELGREVGRGVVEALEEERERELREEELIKYAKARMNGPLPVISSAPELDRKVHLNRDDILIPEHLSERDKRILEEFYGQ